MVNRLLEAYRLVKDMDKVQSWLDREEEWTFDDGVSVYNNASVHKWLRRLRIAAAKACMEACGPSTTPDHRRGMAYGLMLAHDLMKRDFPQSAGASADNFDDAGVEQSANIIAL